MSKLKEESKEREMMERKERRMEEGRQKLKKLEDMISEKAKFRKEEERKRQHLSLVQFRERISNPLYNHIADKKKNPIKNRVKVVSSSSIRSTIDPSIYFDLYNEKNKEIRRRVERDLSEMTKRNKHKEENWIKGKLINEGMTNSKLNKLTKKYIMKIRGYDLKRENKENTFLEKKGKALKKYEEQMKEIKERIREENTHLRDKQEQLKYQIEENSKKSLLNKEKQQQNIINNIRKINEKETAVKKRVEEIEEERTELALYYLDNFYLLKDNNEQLKKQREQFINDQKQISIKFREEADNVKKELLALMVGEFDEQKAVTLD